jgi:hypothetical protein
MWVKMVRLDGGLPFPVPPREADRLAAHRDFAFQPNFSREPTLPPAGAVVYKETCHGNVPSLSKLASMAAVPKIAI